MRREAQAAVAVPLRKAVWNWISNCPGEFNDALRSRGRMEGAPERTFDLLFSMQQGSEKSFWPTLTILNCISSERLSSDFQVSGFGTGHLSGQKSRKVGVNITSNKCPLTDSCYVGPSVSGRYYQACQWKF